MGAYQDTGVDYSHDSDLGESVDSSLPDPASNLFVHRASVAGGTQVCNKMISNIGDVIVIIDASGINRYKSPNLEAIFGWKPEDVIGAPALANVHPEDLAAAEAFIRELLKVPNSINEIECRYLCKDGTYKWICFTGKNLLNDPDICGILGNYHDVTARKQAEHKIAHITTLLNDAQRIANMGAWELDLATGQTFWSDEVYAIHEVGKDFDHSLSSGIAFYHPDDQPIIKQAIEKSIALHIPFDVECRFITAKGNNRWVRASGHPVEKEGNVTHLIGMFQDTTERKNAEEALRQSDYIIKNMQMGLYVYELEDLGDDRTLRLIKANPASGPLTGVAPDDIVGKYIDEIFPYLRALGIPKRFAEVVRSVKPGEIDDFYYSDNRVPEAAYAVKVFPLPHNRVGVAFDNITARKNAEEALLVAKEEAEEANRAKTQFLANMSHELRTPMNGVLGFADLLRYTNLDDTQKKYVSTILSSGKVLLSVIQEILDFSKVEAGKVELDLIETDFYELMRQTADLIECLAVNKGLTFHVDIDSSISRFAMLDPTRLRQILFNLLSNAVKFTEHGEITLTATVVERASNRERITFSVRDTGVGIPENHRKNLFKAFSQGDNTNTRKYGGTGLGLVIADRLAQLMGGKIDFTSTPGKGSEFFFTIEAECILVRDTPVVAEVSESNPDLDITHACRILVAEDDAANMMVACSILQALLPAAEIIEAENGTDALEKILRLRPDLVFMDVQMPGMDGNVVTARLREYELRQNLTRTTVIGLTANALSHDRALSMASGMDDYLAKPVDARIIKAALIKHLALGGH